MEMKKNELLNCRTTFGEVKCFCPSENHHDPT